MKKVITLNIDEKLFRHLQKFALLQKVKFTDCLRNILKDGSYFDKFNLVIDPDDMSIQHWPKQKPVKESDLQEAFYG